MIERGCKSVGIDLGTAHVRLAYVDGQMNPRVWSNSAGELLIPNAVCFDDELLVGDAALSSTALRPERVARLYKPFTGESWSQEIFGRRHTPETLFAIVLARIVCEAEETLGAIPGAVITVPACFSEKQRRVVHQAGAIAGLRVLGTLNDSLAAVLGAGLHRQKRARTVVLFDLGAGTLDVTVMRINSRELEEVAAAGNHQLGGRDWDRRLVHHVCEQFNNHFSVDPINAPHAFPQLSLECEQGKKRLSRLPRTLIRVHADGRDHVCEVARDQFEEISVERLAQARALTERAVTESRLGWDRIDSVFLTGGGSQMPMIGGMLRELSGRNPEYLPDSSLCNALGAATYARRLESAGALRMPVASRNEAGGLIRTAADAGSERVAPALNAYGPNRRPRLVPVTAHGVGFRVRQKGVSKNIELIPRNTPVPASVSRDFQTRAAPGTEESQHVTIAVTQGSATDPKRTQELGLARITVIPTDEAGHPVRLTVAFDEQGRLHVSAASLSSGQDLSVIFRIRELLNDEQMVHYRDLVTSGRIAEAVEPKTELDLVLQFEESDDFDDDGDEDEMTLFEQTT